MPTTITIVASNEVAPFRVVTNDSLAFVILEGGQYSDRISRRVTPKIWFTA